uniref:Uncharacterized protein n=1 Tax=Triticum urartu TaxID=4572 RepID=A0A8R7RDV3_TRIUA
MRPVSSSHAATPPCHTQPSPSPSPPPMPLSLIPCGAEEGCLTCSICVVVVLLSRQRRAPPPIGQHTHGPGPLWASSTWAHIPQICIPLHIRVMAIEDKFLSLDVLRRCCLASLNSFAKLLEVLY